MIYGYARISSKSQEDGFGLEVQRKKLEEAGAQRIFEDVFTGTKMNRPAWDELCSLLIEGDTLVVAKLDRIARTAIDGCIAVRNLVDRGVSVRVLNMGLVENTPVGRMMLTVMFAMAEFDRDMIVERLADGKAVAKQKPGYREGRPKVIIDEEKYVELYRLVEQNQITNKEAASRLGVSEGTWRNIKKEGRVKVA